MIISKSAQVRASAKSHRYPLEQLCCLPQPWASSGTFGTDCSHGKGPHSPKDSSSAAADLRYSEQRKIDWLFLACPHVTGCLCALGLNQHPDSIVTVGACIFKNARKARVPNCSQCLPPQLKTAGAPRQPEIATDGQVVSNAPEVMVEPKSIPSLCSETDTGNAQKSAQPKKKKRSLMKPHRISAAHDPTARQACSARFTGQGQGQPCLCARRQGRLQAETAPKQLIVNRVTGSRIHPAGDQHPEGFQDRLLRAPQTSQVLPLQPGGSPPHPAVSPDPMLFQHALSPRPPSAV